MRMKQGIVAALATGAALAAGSASAWELSGNVGAFSHYMFRGVDQSGVAAVQGGVDAVHGGGLYAGVWASNLDDGESEVDVYVGYTIGNLDLGYVFYGYRDTPRDNYSEVYATYGLGPLSVQLFFTPEYGDTEDEAYYVGLSYVHAFSETLSLTPHVGYSFGDGIENGLLGGVEDSYLDYGLVLTKSIDNDYEFTLGLHGNGETDLLGKERIVVGLKKTFDL